ncbi:MAG: hypothetical protein QF410_15675 [Planctomycetota bacterium]|nr:hypothetical protein [Planctomycetota bacterium]MDP6540985.1 hypothetical protein [Planctomycetota bacterium]
MGATPTPSCRRSCTAFQTAGAPRPRYEELAAAFLPEILDLVSARRPRGHDNVLGSRLMN